MKALNHIFCGKCFNKRATDLYFLSRFPERRTINRDGFWREKYIYIYQDLVLLRVQVKCHLHSVLTGLTMESSMERARTAMIMPRAMAGGIS